jgi:hypothetical protein
MLLQPLVFAYAPLLLQLLMVEALHCCIPASRSLEEEQSRLVLEIDLRFQLA